MHIYILIMFTKDCNIHSYTLLHMPICISLCMVHLLCIPAPLSLHCQQCILACLYLAKCFCCTCACVAHRLAALQPFAMGDHEESEGLGL